jgi:hypothetical protein
MLSGRVSQPPQGRLYAEDTEHRPRPQGVLERGVVLYTEIFFKPNDAVGHKRGNRPATWLGAEYRESSGGAVGSVDMPY